MYTTHHSATRKCQLYLRIGIGGPSENIAILEILQFKYGSRK